MAVVVVMAVVVTATGTTTTLVAVTVLYCTTVSTVAAAAWLASSALLSWYLSNFANYNAIYGSLGALVGMMIWMWVSSIIILLGAEFDSEIARELRET